MVEKLQAFWAKYRRVVFKLMRDSIAPVSVALVWGVYVALKKESNVDGLNAASLAFFLILSFQNLIQRAAKVVHDEEHGEKVLGRFDALEQGFDTLQQGLGELRAQGLVPPPPPPEPPPAAEPELPLPEPPAEPPVPPAAIEMEWHTDDADQAIVQWQDGGLTIAPMQPYLIQAYAVVKSGYYLAAVLVAAVGFEASVRDTARLFGIPDKKMPLAALLRELSLRTADDQKMKTLVTLNRIRNGLVHGEKQTSDLTREEALELIDAFRVGANYLYELPNNWPSISPNSWG
ncbi:hypothetical protein [Bradyrhizobium sp. USDA 10063]